MTSLKRTNRRNQETQSVYADSYFTLFYWEKETTLVNTVAEYSVESRLTISVWWVYYILNISGSLRINTQFNLFLIKHLYSVKQKNMAKKKFIFLTKQLILKISNNDPRNAYAAKWLPMEYVSMLHKLSESTWNSETMRSENIPFIKRSFCSFQIDTSSQIRSSRRGIMNTVSLLFKKGTITEWTPVYTSYLNISNKFTVYLYIYIYK